MCAPAPTFRNAEIPHTEFICMFHIIVRRNSNYLPEQHQQVGLCNDNCVCFDVVRTEILNVILTSEFEMSQNYY